MPRFRRTPPPRVIPMPHERRLVLQHADANGIADAFAEAVARAAALASRRFESQGAQQTSATAWLHVWRDPEHGDSVELAERLELPLAWVRIQVADDEARRTLVASLGGEFPVDPPEQILERLRSGSIVAEDVRPLAIAATPGMGDEARALLRQALASDERNVRSAAAEGMLFAQEGEFAPLLRAAATGEPDARLGEAMLFAADRIDQRNEARSNVVTERVLALGGDFDDDEFVATLEDSLFELGAVLTRASGSSPRDVVSVRSPVLVPADTRTGTHPAPPPC
jgi:hypothetical protein